MSGEVAELARRVDFMPDGWCATRLGDVAALSGGTTPSRAEAAYWENATIPWATPSDLTSLAIGVTRIADTQTKVSEGALAECSLTLNPPGTVLMTSRATIGFVAINQVPMATNQGFITFRAGKSIEPDFLLYWLTAQRENLVAAAGGSTFKELSRGTAKLLPILLPPFAEQRRIADVLRSVDEAIAAANALLVGVRASKQAAMEATLSGGFLEVRLESLLAETRYPMRSGPFGSALLKSELEPDGIPFLGIDNVHVERFVPVYRRFVSEAKYRELARYTVYPGDLMVTIMGTVGRCCVVPSDVGVAISSKHVWTLTIDQDRYSPALLAWQINHSPRVLEQLQGSAQGGIMSAISSGTLRDLLVPLPAPAEMREIEGLLLSFNTQIAALEAEQDKATHLKAALMSDLLSGRVRVPE